MILDITFVRDLTSPFQTARVAIAMAHAAAIKGKLLIRSIANSAPEIMCSLLCWIRSLRVCGRDGTFPYDHRQGSGAQQQRPRSRQRYPKPGSVGCEVSARWRDSDGRELIRISTARPWGIESTEGVSEFVVLAEQLESR